MEGATLEARYQNTIVFKTGDISDPRTRWENVDECRVGEDLEGDIPGVFQDIILVFIWEN
jgi:hypothetical protein